MTRMKSLALAAVAAVSLTALSTPKAEAARIPWGILTIGVVAAGTMVGIVSSRASAAPRQAGGCTITRRWIRTPYGPAFRRVRICD